MHKVRFALESHPGEYLCYETELPFVPSPGMQFWELPGMEGWVEPYTCGEACYLFRDQLLVVSEEVGFDEVDEQEQHQLKKAGWVEREYPFGRREEERKGDS